MRTLCRCCLPVEHTERFFDVCLLLFVYDLYLVYDLDFCLALLFSFRFLVFDLLLLDLFTFSTVLLDRPFDI